MPTPKTVSIASEVLRADISALGAELQSLTTHDGRDLLWNGDPAVWRGRAPILFPVIGVLQGGRYRLGDESYDMPKHGFARHSAFELLSTTAASATFRLSATTATLDIYPFHFQLDIGFELVGTALMLRALIANRGDGPMPASFGFHPAFRWPLPFGAARADHRLLFAEHEPAPIRRIDDTGVLKRDPEPSPVVGDTLTLRDELFVDDALIFDRLASRSILYGAPSGPQLRLRFDDFPTLGLWTKPGADFICLEPWHGVSDPAGFAGEIWEKPGIFEVAPGAARSFSMSISLEPEPSA